LSTPDMEFREVNDWAKATGLISEAKPAFPQGSAPACCL
jgi:hypothetical protein